MAWKTKLTFHLTCYGLDPERLEAECNRMSDRGWQLKYYGALFGCYRRGDPNEYEYRTLVIKDEGMEEDEYAAALAELGIEKVDSWGEVLILRRRVDGAPFELYSDLDSRIAQQKKARRFLRNSLLASLLMFIYIGYTGPLRWLLHNELFSGDWIGNFLQGAILLFFLGSAVSAIDCARGLLHSKKVLERLEAERVVQE